VSCYWRADGHYKTPISYTDHERRTAEALHYDVPAPASSLSVAAQAADQELTSSADQLFTSSADRRDDVTMTSHELHALLTEHDAAAAAAVSDTRGPLYGAFGC